MSLHACYLARTAAGLCPESLRLVGPSTDVTWTAPPPGAGGVVERTEVNVRGAAGWLEGHASGGALRARRLDLLILDAPGSTCRWLDAPSDDPDVLVSMLAPPDRAEAAEPAPVAPSGVQLLAPAQARGAGTMNGKGRAPARSAVLSVADAGVRLLLDELDERGVTVGRVESIWHAIARAWDPGAPGSSVRNEGPSSARVVAESQPVSAVVLIDPAGYLVWSWSRAGVLLAGGSVRVRTVRTLVPERAGARVVDGEDQSESAAPDPQSVSRLALDWIAWSTQLALAPARLVCIGPEAGEGESGLGASGVVRRLVEAWPGATAAAVEESDPIGATLRRLVGERPAARAASGSGAGMEGLTRRPTRAHRRLQHGVAALLGAGALLLASVGYRFWSAREAVLRRTAETTAGVRAEAIALLPAGADPRFLRDAIEREIAALSARAEDVLPPSRPLLSQIERLSLVLGSSQVKLVRLQGTQGLIVVTVAVSDQALADELSEALDKIRGSELGPWSRQARPVPQGSGFEYTFTATWAPTPTTGRGT